jgi:glucans biosynthesis protein C
MPKRITAADASRRTDLDWVRIGAFGLLIFYHVGVFYAPGPSAVGATSPRTLPWLLIPMLMLNPWRLLVLFIVSGAATRFMSDKMQAGALFASRSARLLIPLAFGIVVIVPPQCFVQVVERCGYSGSYFDFWGRYLAADQHLCAAGPHLIVPTYNHLWFAAYLWVFTAALALALALAPGLLVKLQRLVERALARSGLVIWPAIWLAFAWLVLEHRFPLSGNPVSDWYGYAIYVPAFLFGFVIAKSDALWARIERVRRAVLAGALASYCVMVGLAILTLGAQLDWGAKMASSPAGFAGFALRVPGSLVYGLNQWLWILAVFGFAHRYLSGRDGPTRRYLTEAIFPFYIIHQTTIEVVGHYLAKERLALGVEAALLIGATAASCVATYEIVRRVRPLRALFGLKPTAQTLPRVWPAFQGSRRDRI